MLIFRWDDNIKKCWGETLCHLWSKEKNKVGGHFELVFAKPLNKCWKEKLVLEKGLISFSKATFFDVMFYDEFMCGLSQNASWQHSIEKPVWQNWNWSVNKHFVWMLNVVLALNSYQIRMDITLKICAQCYLDYFPCCYGTQKKGSGQKKFVKHAFAFPHSYWFPLTTSWRAVSNRLRNLTWVKYICGIKCFYPFSVTVAVLQ